MLSEFGRFGPARQRPRLRNRSAPLIPVSWYDGRLGDRIGRKRCFMITMVMMGLSTVAVGLLPTYAQIGVGAPVLLVFLRLTQGLAVGGEYGSAATYVAEHAPGGHRGYYTSWLQTTSTVGLLLSLLVILACRLSLGNGLISRSPLKESFGSWSNLKGVLITLFGITSGMTVIWYGAQFYALFFVQNTLQADYKTSYTIFAIALSLGTPLIVFFGAFSDRVGRRPVMIDGMLLGALTFIPSFHALAGSVNPSLSSFSERNPIVVSANDCSFSLFAAPTSSCDRGSVVSRGDCTRDRDRRLGVPAGDQGPQY